MPSNFSRRTVGLALVACIVTPLSWSTDAAGAPDEALVAAAKKEGSVTWYSAQGAEQNERFAQAFRDRYGIKVDIQRGPSGVLAQRYLSEKGTGRTVCDVLSISTAAVYRDLTGQGVLARLTKEDVPSLADWPRAGLRFGSTAVVLTQIYGFAYNTKLVKPEELPRAFEDLVKPVYRNRMAAPKWDVSPLYDPVLKLWQEKFGSEYLKAFSAQNPTLYTSVVSGLQGLAAGEYHILPLVASAFIPPLQKAGAPIGYIVPPVTTGNEIHMAISSKAPHPHAARLFMSFMLSKEGQEIFNGTDAASLRPDTRTLKLPAGYVPPQEVDAAKTAELRNLVQGGR